MTDLIRKSDAIQTVFDWEQDKISGTIADAIAALPAATVGADAVLDAAHKYLLKQYGASPLDHPIDRARILAALAPAPDPAAMPQAKRCAACGSTVTDLDDHLVHDEECGGEPDEPVAAPNLKRIGTGLYETQPAPDPAAIRETALREALKALDRLPEYGSPDVNIGVGNAYSAILALIQKGAADDRV